MNGSEALLTGLVDYAGLFPPAGLSMADAVARHAADLRGPQAWMLGRFVVPANRLDEFAAAFDATDPPPGRPWRLSALIAGQSGEDFRAIAAFNDRPHAAALPAAVVDAWEGKADDGHGVDRLAAAAAAGPGLQGAYEVPPAPESWAPMVAAIHQAGGIAKLRTGGLVASAIPPTRAVAAFIWQCVSTGVPFKATAGLHHPVRGQYRLTYLAGSPTAMMHGFLNVFVAAVFARQIVDSAEFTGEGVVDLLDRVLDETDVSAFRISPSAIAWRDRQFAPDVVRRARSVALSFGSCSFNEPVADLQAMGINLDRTPRPGNRP